VCQQKHHCLTLQESSESNVPDALNLSQHISRILGRH